MNSRFKRNVIPHYVAFFVCGSAACFPALAADWPQHRGSQSGAAAAPATSGRLLVPVWTKRLPGINIGGTVFPGSVTANAAIVNGVVYVGSRNTRLYALDAATGATNWEFEANRPVETSPLVKDGAVYFAPFNGNLTALNTADGSVRWVHGSGGQQERSSPNYSSGRIIAASSYPNKFVYAVDEASANPAPFAWRFDTGQFIYASAAVEPVSGNIFCPSDDGRLYGITPDGAALWPAPFEMMGGVYRASPAVANGKVYLSSGDYDWALHAVSAATGELVWDAPMVPTPTLPSTYYRAIQVSSPAVDGDFVSIVGGYGNGLGPSILYAFRDKGDSAETLWTCLLYTSRCV